MKIPDNAKGKLYLKITFLGTASVHSSPLSFCNCEICNTSRKLVGEEKYICFDVVVLDYTYGYNVAFDGLVISC